MPFEWTYNDAIGNHKTWGCWSESDGFNFLIEEENKNVCADFNFPYTPVYLICESVKRVINGIFFSICIYSDGKFVLKKEYKVS